MKSKVTGFIIFLLGVVLGTAFSCRYFKNRYEQIAQEEIDSVKEVFFKSNTEKSQLNEVKVEELSDYADTIASEGYSPQEREAIREAMAIPYVISPDEFGEREDYEMISLIYYSDGILADDCDEIIEDVEETVGFDSLNHFGEFEDDAVFVRNDRRECDYEILMDNRNYSEVVKSKPYLNRED